MLADYSQLTQRVINRINPDHIAFEKAFNEELTTRSYDKALLYIRYAMKGVEPAYTQKSKEAGERVKAHLEREISSIVFRYQGSVMTDTHIKGHSDIDLLTITNKFYGWDFNNIKEAANSIEGQRFYGYQLEKLKKETQVGFYSGNSNEDLKQLRLDCERVLSSKYSICEKTKPKSIKIKNLDLNREVDIVIANWYDDVLSVINDKGSNRGIQIYNKEKEVAGDPDYPFLSIERINTRSSLTGGRLKRMIRFLKNIKADSDLDIDLSSFDFNAICYDIPTEKYSRATFVELLPVIYNQLRSISADTTYANRIVSVDGREYIFRYSPSKLENVRKILKEVEAVYTDTLKKNLHN